jgi:hypothetical protein
MAMHTDVTARMREEVLRVCGPASHAPTYTDLKQLKYGTFTIAIAYCVSS